MWTNAAVVATALVAVAQLVLAVRTHRRVRRIRRDLDTARAAERIAEILDSPLARAAAARAERLHAHRVAVGVQRRTLLPIVPATRPDGEARLVERAALSGRLEDLSGLDPATEPRATSAVTTPRPVGRGAPESPGLVLAPPTTCSDCGPDAPAAICSDCGAPLPWGMIHRCGRGSGTQPPSPRGEA